MSTRPNQSKEESGAEISVKGKWVRVPAMDINGKTIIVRGRWLKIACILDEDWLETGLEDPQLCVQKLKEQRSNGMRADIFSFTQKLPATVPLYEYPSEWDSIAAIRITGFKEWWEKLPQETRKNVRRSQKRGIVVGVKEFNDELINNIVVLNNESPVRQGRPFAHYSKTFEQVKRDYSSFQDRSDCICASVGNELVGLLKIVYRGDVASILQLFAKASHYDRRPTNALLAKAVQLCEAKGIGYLTYGMFNYGNRTNSPLREFKIRNGFTEVLVPRYIIPLTEWGTLCLKIRLHRGPIGILPPRIIAAVVSARSKWYHLRQSMSRCSSMAERPRL